MNTLKCSNCGMENAYGLSFCTNCGISISSAPPPTEFMVSAQNPVQPKKSNTIRNLIIAGGLGLVLLLAVGIVAIGALYVIGLNVQNQKASADQPNNNTTGIRSSANKDSDYDDTDIEANPFTMPPSVGKFEQISTMVGHPGNDFPGAEKVVKAVFENKGREVEFLVAEFDGNDNSKKGYDDLMNGLNKEGAKLIGKQKVKNKAGINNGEFSVYTLNKKWNALAHSEKYGFRMASADRYALMEFANALGEMFGDE